MNQETFRLNLENNGDSDVQNQSRWNALDPNMEHPLSRFLDSDEGQSAAQTIKELQFSEEQIFIKDSAEVTVNTTDTKAALSLVAALNAAISLVLNISIASSSQADEIKQDLFQSIGLKQVNLQKTVIENSRDVKVTTTDTQLVINIQLLLQILLALLINLDIL